MKNSLKTALVLLVAIGAMGALVFAFLKMSAERQAEAERERPVVAKSRVTSGANGEIILTLEREAQAKIALQAEPLRPAMLSPEVRGFARVMDPSPLVALVAELASAEAAAAASEKEFERVKRLNEQANASDRALQAVEATAQRDHIAVESVHLRLVSAWGTAIAEQPDLAVFVRSLASLESALVRIDLPAGQMLKATPPARESSWHPLKALPFRRNGWGRRQMLTHRCKVRGFCFSSKRIHSDSLREGRRAATSNSRVGR